MMYCKLPKVTTLDSITSRCSGKEQGSARDAELTRESGGNRAHTTLVTFGISSLQGLVTFGEQKTLHKFGRTVLFFEIKDANS